MTTQEIISKLIDAKIELALLQNIYQVSATAEAELTNQFMNQIEELERNLNSINSANERNNNA